MSVPCAERNVSALPPDVTESDGWINSAYQRKVDGVVWGAQDRGDFTDWRQRRWYACGIGELEYRLRNPGEQPDTGWYLYGPDGAPFGAFMHRKLCEAMRLSLPCTFGGNESGDDR